MALLTRFDTPGRVRDLPGDSPFYATWHQLVSDTINNQVSRDPGFETPAPNSGFYNATVTDVNVLATRPLVWMGFPRDVLMSQLLERRDAFRRGEIRGVQVPDGKAVQIEYLEWFTQRDARGRITKVTFTAEMPEYWRTLFAAPGGPDRVLALYRELNGNPAIALSEITDASGNYDPFNVWNTSRGIVHYICDRIDGAVNSMRGALNLAGLGSLASVVSDNFQLGPGAPTSSDPRVTLDFRTLARRGLHLTAADPIGLYIGGWDDTGWSRPDGSPVGDYWKIIRPAGALGPPALRLVYEVPPGEGFVVGDIRIGGRPIEFGGQIAEHLTVMFTGLAGVLP